MKSMKYFGPGHSAIVLSQLLSSVVEGDLEAVDRLMQEQTGALALRLGDIMDPAGRRFQQISALGYSLWADDIAMFDRLAKHLSEKQKQEAWVKHQNEGVQYKHAGTDEIVTAVYFNPRPLIEAYQVYVQYLGNNSEPINWARRSSYHTNIGLAQFLLPAPWVRAYCGSAKTKALNHLQAPGEELWQSWWARCLNGPLGVQGLAAWRNYSEDRAEMGLSGGLSLQGLLQDQRMLEERLERVGAERLLLDRRYRGDNTTTSSTAPLGTVSAMR